MRIKGIALEYHCYVPVFGVYVVYKLTVYVQFAAGNIFKTRYHSQSCRFTAAGRTYEHDKFTVLDFHIEIFNGYEIA